MDTANWQDEEDEEELDGMYWSIDLTNVTAPWPDSYQPSVWESDDATIFATDEAELLSIIQEAYDEWEEETPQNINGWRKLKPETWVEFYSPYDEDLWGDFPDVRVQVEELLFLGRLTGMGVFICGDSGSPLQYWSGVRGY